MKYNKLIFRCTVSLIFVATSITVLQSYKNKNLEVEPITLKVFIGDPIQYPSEDNKIYQLIEKELGVKFEFEYLTGDLNQRMGVMIASADYPDLIMGDTERLISAGAFLPIEDYINDSTPNLKAHIEPYIKKIEDANGHIYVIPDYGRYYGKAITSYYSGPAFWIQKAILKEFNYPKITTLDQYFNVIQKYKELHPVIDGKNTIGFQILSYDWRAFCLKNPPVQLSGHPNDGDVEVNPLTNVASISATTDDAKKYYKKLNEVYNEGLIEPETFVQDYDEYLAAIASGTVLGMFDQGWNFQTATNSLIAQNKIERTYVPLPIVFDESITPYYKDRPVLNINRGFGITVDCKDPQRVIKLFDVLLSEKWQKILTWGIQGEDYEVDSKGVYYRDEEQRKQYDNSEWRLMNKADALYSYLPKMEGVYSDGNACLPSDQPNEFFSTLQPYDKDILNHYDIKMFTDMLGEAPENPKYYPLWTIDLGDGTDAAITAMKISELQLKYLPRIILSKTEDFDHMWKDYIAEFDKINVKDYEDFINERIQWRLNNW